MNMSKRATAVALRTSVWRSSSACSVKPSRADGPRPKALSTRMPWTDCSMVVARSPFWSCDRRESTEYCRWKR